MIFDALARERMTASARAAVEEGDVRRDLACCDISLWEIAMLIGRGRLSVESDTADFIEAMLTARSIRTLPISPAVAAISQSLALPHGDPADRLIAATTLHHGARLVTSDRFLPGLEGLETIW